jgi:GTP cyclohydrolase-4
VWRSRFLASDPSCYLSLAGCGPLKPGKSDAAVSDSRRPGERKGVQGTPLPFSYLAHTASPHPLASPVSLPDVQAQPPAFEVSLSRVGVTAVEKVLRIRQNGSEQLFSARLECVVDLGSAQKGAHMSRFEETVNEAIGEVIVGEAGFRAEALAQRVAELVRERQGARRAEVTIAARYPEHKPAPLSGIVTQEIYTLYGSAVASARGTRRLVGVAAPGVTACPCAQQLVAGRARERLEGRGFSGQEIDRILTSVPVDTHNQRGIGTLLVGCTERCDDDIDAGRLLAIVEDAMSSEIYELMKRADEAAVVEKAHRRPRFVEDCVREMIRGVVDAFPELADAAFVSARQENLETIHQHNVVAERFGLLGEIRRELRTGEHPDRHTTREAWLDGATC